MVVDEKSTRIAPWFTEIINFLVRGIIPHEMDAYRRKKFVADSNKFVWHDLVLFRHCLDGMLRRCIPADEMR